MKDLKTLIKQIDLGLIEETNSKILELGKIATEEKYNKKSVIEKIREVNKKLNQINTVPQSFSKEYKEIFLQWVYKLEEKQKPYKLFIDESKEVMKAATKIKIEKKDLEKKTDLIEKFIEKYSDDYIQHITKEAFTFDIQEVVLLQSQYTFIKFARQRKKIHIFTDYLFKSRLFLLTFVSGVILALLTTFIGSLVGLVMNPYSVILISLISFGISFFTFAKWIKKKSDKWFWRIVRQQTLILYRQLQVYTSQIASITEFFKTEFITEHKTL